MPEDPKNLDDRIKKDLEGLKNELLDLTKAQRRIILEEYENGVREYTGINMREYKAFIDFLLEMEEEK